MPSWRGFGRGMLTALKVGASVAGVSLPATTAEVKQVVTTVKQDPWGMLIKAAIAAVARAEQINPEQKQGEMRAAAADARIEGALLVLIEDLLKTLPPVKKPESIDMAMEAAREMAFHLADATGQVNQQKETPNG